MGIGWLIASISLAVLRFAAEDLGSPRQDQSVGLDGYCRFSENCPGHIICFDWIYKPIQQTWRAGVLHLKAGMAATVLIVDDNPDIRNVLASYLDRSGHQVLEAANGAMGIQRATAESPNFVLLDLYLPDMNGLEVARTLRKTPVTQHIPIVGWTVDCRATMYREALAAGYIDFCLDKPVSVSVIEALVERYAKQEC